ncbi:MAG TPA: squalene synthase HpnC [Solirubrobacteraceae bacterium]|nr:squalene synthase HpnC [Solirubrobacteraceae bacterium]
MTATAQPASPLAHAPTRAAVMAQAGSENFPVAARLVGATRRAHLRAIYGFARLVDDAGDEAAGDRTALLDEIEADLDRVYTSARPEHPLLRALSPTVRALDLPAAPFRRLIEANRRDQLIDRYPDFAALLDYCQLSAAPVGELVLHIFGAATRDRIRLSDQICAGLQVTEHLQDVAEDRERGRVYLPAEDLARFGCADADLLAPAPTRPFAELMAFEVARARCLLSAGAPLLRRLEPSAAFAVAGFVAGGRAALDAVEGAGYDVLSARPRPTRRAFAAALATTLWRRR